MNFKDKIVRYFKRKKAAKKALDNIDTVCWYFNHTKKLTHTHKILKSFWREDNVFVVLVEFRMKNTNELRRIEFEYDITGEIIPERNKRLSFEF